MHPTAQRNLDALEKLEGLLKHRRYQRKRRVAKRTLDALELTQAAREQGLEALEVARDFRIFHDSVSGFGFFQNMSSALTSFDRTVSHRKHLTHQVLQHRGLPTTAGRAVRTPAELEGVLKSADGPWVLKPTSGSGGRGVVLDVTSYDQAMEICDPFFKSRRAVVVEEMFFGIDVRVAVVQGKARAATLRVPANVVGDGRLTIRDLVDRKNLIRSSNDYLIHQRIRLNPNILETLGKQGLSANSVPPAGHRVFLHMIANISSGGDSYEIGEFLHQDIKQLAVEAAALFPTALHAGIDILAESFDEPLDEQRAVITEVNLNNELPLHRYPWGGETTTLHKEELEAHREVESTIPTPDILSVKPVAKATVTPGDLRNLLEEESHGVAGADQNKPDREAPPRVPLRRLDSQLLAAAIDGQLAPGKNARVSVRDSIATLYENGIQRHFLDVYGNNQHTSLLSRRPALRREYFSQIGADPLLRFTARELSRDSFMETNRRVLESSLSPWELSVTDLEAAGQDTVLKPGGHLQTVLDGYENGSVQLEQKWDAPALVLLLRGSEVIGRQLVVGPTIVGDGSTGIEGLVDRQLRVGVTHPRTWKPIPPRQRRIVSRVLERRLRAKIPAIGETVEVPNELSLLRGARTLNLEKAPDSGPEAQAELLQKVIGNRGLASYTYVLRANTGGSYSWALYDLAHRPSLSRFLYPCFGPPIDVVALQARTILASSRFQVG